MPATQRGHARKLPSGKWQLRYYDGDGTRHTGGTFASKSAAMQHYRDVIEPRLNGTEAQPELTLSELVELYLERHAAVVRPRTITTLRERLVHATRAYGDVPLGELERMAGELAAWQATLPERSRYGIVQALRQTLGAAVRWDYMSRNPAKLAGRNPEPPPRTIRVYTLAELDALAAELSKPYQPLPAFAAATGLRPEEWAALERRDLDRRAGILTVRRTVSDGVVVELTKTNASRRQVPLSRRASAALDALPPRLDTPLLFPAPEGGLLDLDNFRRREWAVAVKASGVATPARMYDLRSTFASNALAAGVTVFELARVMGTSVRMIERHYGALLDGAHNVIASRLDEFEAELEQAVADGTSPGWASVRE
jgi:integrase